MRAPGLGRGDVGRGKTPYLDGTLRSMESTSTDGLWEEKAEAQAGFVQRKLAHHVRIGGTSRKGSGREEGHIEPPAKVFSDITDPDSLRLPELTHAQATLAAALVSATLEAP